jgi:hypothetical protein
LNDYLLQTEDERDVSIFLDTYDSDESAAIYEYAIDDGRILSEQISYCDDFTEAYEDFIERTQMFNPGKKPEAISTKENYYWVVYAMRDSF